MPPLTPVTRRGRKKLSLVETDFTEGVFLKLSASRLRAADDAARLDVSCSLDNNKQHLPDNSDSTSTTDNTTPSVSPPTSWKSTECASFMLQRQPLLACDPEDKSTGGVVDEAEAMGLILQRSRQLPSTWYYSSNHVMVNEERTKRVIAPLHRLSDLDTIAREQAESMAALGRLFHSDPRALCTIFNRPARRMGENVAVGENIREIHKAMMKTKSDRRNILDRRYTHFGMGTAKGVDGKLYLCQVFCG
jgi:hypothetical protein